MEEDEFAKLTPEFKEEIECLFNLSSKFNNVLLIQIATICKAVYLLKKKSILLTERIFLKEHETNLIQMMQKKFYAKRLQRKQDELQWSPFMSRDQIIQDENDKHDREEEEKKEV